MDAGMKDEEIHTEMPSVPGTGRALGPDRITEQLAAREPDDVAARGEEDFSKVGRGTGLKGLYEARRPLTPQQTRQLALQQRLRAEMACVDALLLDPIGLPSARTRRIDSNRRFAVAANARARDVTRISDPEAWMEDVFSRKSGSSDSRWARGREEVESRQESRFE